MSPIRIACYAAVGMTVGAVCVIVGFPLWATLVTAFVGGFLLQALTSRS